MWSRPYNVVVHHTTDNRYSNSSLASTVPCLHWRTSFEPTSFEIVDTARWRETSLDVIVKHEANGP